MAAKKLKLNREVLSQSSGWNSSQKGGTVYCDGTSMDSFEVCPSTWCDPSFSYCFTCLPTDLCTEETGCGTCQGPGGCQGGTLQATCATCQSNCETCYNSCPVSNCC